MSSAMASGTGEFGSSVRLQKRGRNADCDEHWERVARACCEAGFERDGKECENKWNELLRGFVQIFNFETDSSYSPRRKYESTNDATKIRERLPIDFNMVAYRSMLEFVPHSRAITFHESNGEVTMIVERSREDKSLIASIKLKKNSHK